MPRVSPGWTLEMDDRDPRTIHRTNPKMAVGWDWDDWGFCVGAEQGTVTWPSEAADAVDKPVDVFTVAIADYYSVPIFQLVGWPFLLYVRYELIDALLSWILIE